MRITARPMFAILNLPKTSAVARLGLGGVESGTMPIVLDPGVGAGLLDHLLRRDLRRRNHSQDQLPARCDGHSAVRVRHPHFDDPHRPHGLSSRPFDGEGLPVSPTALVENGMLETWLLDSASAGPLGLEPTGHASRGIGGVPGPGHGNLYMELYMENGRMSFETLAAGFLVGNGEIARAVSEITVADTLQSMFREMTPANDREFRYGINVPTLRIEG